MKQQKNRYEYPGKKVRLPDETIYSSSTHRVREYIHARESNELSFGAESKNKSSEIQSPHKKTKQTIKWHYNNIAWFVSGPVLGSKDSKTNRTSTILSSLVLLRWKKRRKESVRYIHQRINPETKYIRSNRPSFLLFFYMYFVNFTTTTSTTAAAAVLKVYPRRSKHTHRHKNGHSHSHSVSPQQPYHAVHLTSATAWTDSATTLLGSTTAINRASANRRR